MAAPAPLLFQVAPGRRATSLILTSLAWTLTILASFPLLLVIYHLYLEGCAKALPNLSWRTLTGETPVPNSAPGTGGIGNALGGTALMVGIGFLLSVPSGIGIAIYIGELSPRSYLAAGVRFATRLLTGLPSILAGVFAYAAIVKTTTNRYSAFAGGVGLAVLMLPMIIVTAEAAILAVPQKMRLAAFGMGATRTQVILRVLLPYAMPNIFTGVLLAIARAAGETAPLLFTAGWSMYYIRTNVDDTFRAVFRADFTEAAKQARLCSDDIFQTTPSISRLVYDFGSGIDAWHQQLAWTGALVMVLFILLLNITAQLISARVSRHH